MTSSGGYRGPDDRRSLEAHRSRRRHDQSLGSVVKAHVSQFHSRAYCNGESGSQRPAANVVSLTSIDSEISESGSTCAKSDN
ncbi:hypothetical protein PUN28_013639 [Cardiocondyla obscurior]|uniref:Uncharacterized protein n=1 Tax=Cardiocondyla obscurior TaxID=286306 RepID=A0AAW2F3M3_9HYME